MKKKYSDPLMFSNVMLSGVISKPSQQGGPLFSAGKLGVSRPEFVEEGSYSNEVSIPGQEDVQNQTEEVAPGTESAGGNNISEEMVEDVMDQVVDTSDQNGQVTVTP